MPNKHIELHTQVSTALESLHNVVQDIRDMGSDVGYLFPRMAKDLYDLANRARDAHDQLRDAHSEGIAERVRYSDEVSRNLMEVALHTFGQFK